MGEKSATEDMVATVLHYTPLSLRNSGSVTLSRPLQGQSANTQFTSVNLQSHVTHVHPQSNVTHQRRLGEVKCAQCLLKTVVI